LSRPVSLPAFASFTGQFKATGLLPYELSNAAHQALAQILGEPFITGGERLYHPSTLNWIGSAG